METYLVGSVSAGLFLGADVLNAAEYNFFVH